MDLGLQDKVALVTGAGSQIGFGKGIALMLAKEGCDIAAADIDLEGTEKTVAEIKALGKKALAIKADVTRSVSVNEMVKATLAKFGKLDILVNNAGDYTQPKPFIKTTEADWDNDININLRGVLNCTMAALPGMIEHGYGKIVSITSGAGIIGGFNTAVYSAAEAGIMAFTKSVAREVTRSGINMNCVSPGLANTGFARKAPPGLLQNFVKTIPIGRMTVPQDIANVVAFLVSDVAIDIVGQTIIVTGNINP
jgi:NAD(P)-dependent dehydrogenase (short-subunit alcohol dehydrogenase family)